MIKNKKRLPSRDLQGPRGYGDNPARGEGGCPPAHRTIGIALGSVENEGRAVEGDGGLGHFVFLCLRRAQLPDRQGVVYTSLGGWEYRVYGIDGISRRAGAEAGRAVVP